MAFSYSIIYQTWEGDRKVIYGSYTNTESSTGGDVTLGLNVVEHFQMQPTGSAVETDEAVANETFPLTGSTPVTIVTVANGCGLFRAVGF